MVDKQKHLDTRLHIVYRIRQYPVPGFSGEEGFLDYLASPPSNHKERVL